MAQKYLFIAILCAKMSRVNKALHFCFICECAETSLQSTFPTSLNGTVRQLEGGHIKNDVTQEQSPLRIPLVDEVS